MVPSPPPASSRWMKWAIVLLPLGYLWFRLINNLRLEWATNPQYSYGWVVPFLCIGLLIRRWQSAGEKKLKAEILKTEIGEQYSIVNNQHSEANQISASQRFSASASNLPFQLSAFSVSAFCLLALMYLPTRLIEEATPEWRPIQWALGFETIGLTLCTVYMAKGRGWLRQVAFPLCFFFIAIPWPTPIEAPVIQSLTRINSGIVVELLGWSGIPALQHGNLIEVGTGTVGVSQACSGIRSFQTSLMISLFFGEFYAMGFLRRLLLFPAGFILAMAFNVCRMSFLTSVAAKKGVAAIAQYHDQAGVTITITCTLVLWGVSVLLKEKLKTESIESTREIAKTENRNEFQVSKFQVSAFQKVLSPQPSRLLPLSIALLLWLFAVEAGAELWYCHLESHLAASPQWSVEFPTNNPTFNTVPIDAVTENLLRCDEGKQGEWQDADGSRWEAFYFNWFPGRVAGYLAKRHTPEICLTATGLNMVSGPELTMMHINGVALPVRSYIFGTGNADPMYVFHCRWEAGVNEGAYVAHESARFNLIRGIWAGRGNKGQKVVEFIISGYEDTGQAKAALVRQLQKMIRVKK